MPDIITNGDDLTADAIEHMTAKELLGSVVYAFDIEPIRRVEVLGYMRLRASELKLTRAVNDMISTYNKEDSKLSTLSGMDNSDDFLEHGKDGTLKQSVDNIYAIMTHDKTYDGIRFNEMTQNAEIERNGKKHKWTDTEEAKSEKYIEKRYGIYNDKKHLQALRILFELRSYNPIKDIIESVEWDGLERCEQFLTKWALCEDTEYTREVSRLIFAGGVWRLYQPGSKVDDVPVLIGKQGGGKSSLVRFLAINDDYYGEIKTVETDKSIEQLSGKWICEIAELSAFTKAKEIESVKAFITRQRDSYRKPYDRNVTDLPRRCMFIGTTNNPNFLVDLTGNRRFYPVETKSDGYWLYDHETECREYILQCWAEAAQKYKDGNMPNYAKPELREEYRKAQQNSMVDDWRVGVVNDWLSRRDVDDVVCVRQIFHEALSSNPDFPVDPNPKESREVGQMVSNNPEWEKIGPRKLRTYGSQIAWRKISSSTTNDQTANDYERVDVADLDLPFDL